MRALERTGSMAKAITATQRKALEVLADGKERQVYECGATNTVEALHVRGLVEWRPSERTHLTWQPGYALVKINDAGRAALSGMIRATRVRAKEDEVEDQKEPTLDDATKTWRDTRRERLCGDKVLMFLIKPKDCSGWLYLERLEDAEDFMLDGEPEDEWEMKMSTMTREQVEALPEFGGW
jgi:hypothetical protein